LENNSNKKEIAIVVPTIRKESWSEFVKAWDSLFRKHNVWMCMVEDGDDPHLSIWRWLGFGADRMFLSQDSRLSKLVYNRSDVVRNFGFWGLQYTQADYIITLDDDVKPIGDPIQAHVDALNMKVPVSWMSTASEYMRGFPYDIREESQVMLSHGVWEGVKDWDAQTQLRINDVKQEVDFFKGVVPKGTLFPMCGMNLAFRREILPYMYFAPMGHRVGLDRFGDIWLGVTIKKMLDEMGFASVSGYSKVLHERASDPITNLKKEAIGMMLNEQFWRGDFSDPYFSLYSYKLQEWIKLMSS
jgi:reversibly glycosylated polypeptide/UDP-arabinopyranose mutase